MKTKIGTELENGILHLCDVMENLINKEVNDGIVTINRYC